MGDILELVHYQSYSHSLHSQIYSDDIEWFFNSNVVRKFKRLGSFSDALTFLFTEGEYVTSEAFLQDHQPTTAIGSTVATPMVGWK